METIKLRKKNVFKIAIRGKRKDATRHFLKSFTAGTIDEAVDEFKKTADEYYKVPANRSYRFELCTGNWKPITYYEYKKEEK